ncbi:hypothetical protein RTP6_001702 [Batrachochytrium dendrobatidis]
MTAINDAAQVENRNGYGRCMIATKDLRVGLELMMEKPYVAVVDDASLNQTCSGCFRLAAHMQQCSSCKVVQYCSQTCQRSDWSIHKPECEGFKAVQPRIPPSPVRLLGRMMFKRAKDCNEFERVVGQLESHRDKRASKDIEHIAAMLQMASGFIPPALLLSTTADMIALCCKIQVNTMTTERGVAIYDRLSTVNHSCVPNACLTFGIGGIARLSPMTAIASGDQITISYVDVFQSCETRQRQLKEQYYFDCTCRLCTANANGGMAGRDLMICTTALPTRCSGYWTTALMNTCCSICNRCDVESRQQCISQFDSAVDLYQSTKKQTNDASASQSILTRALESLELIVCKSHSVLIRLRTDLIEILVGQRNYAKVIELSNDQLDAFRCVWKASQSIEKGISESDNAYPVWPMESVSSVDIFKASMWTMDDDLDRVAELGKQAAHNLRITHGEKHPMYLDLTEGLEDVLRELEARHSGVDSVKMKLI